jgi:glycosyltransferase involved in cell wall biosynthesis
MTFAALLTRIAQGEAVAAAELLPYLSLERHEHRAEVNALLASAFLQSGRQTDLEQARVFIQRAWVLSRFAPHLLELYKQISSALGDISGIRNAYKRLGMTAASRDDLSEAIKYFDMWHYAYVEIHSLDKYEYDFDILDCMDRLAKPYRFLSNPRAEPGKERNIRVAYLLKGITETGSILIKLNLFFAQFHDRQRVEPIFFVPESEITVRGSAAGREHLQLFESYQCKLMMPSDHENRKERLLAVGRMIAASAPDVLITSAALADFEHYFITSLRPAPVVVGFVQGPPAQFAPPSLDWGIAWNTRPLMDCPVSCSPVHMEEQLPDRSRIIPYEKSEFDLPENACIITSAGRHVKFQDLDFWKAIIDLLGDHPEAYYLALGVEEAQIPFLSPLLTSKVRSQIRFTGWRGSDYLRILCLAHIFIDTFPSGGGGVLVDAMALGIPVVSFQDDYWKLYDQTDWSPAEEIFNVAELIVPRGDFEKMKGVVARLITDREYRQDMAQRCQAYMLENKGDPARAVQRCEDLYFQILEQKINRKAPPDPRAAEIEALLRGTAPQDVLPAGPSRVARTAFQLKRVLRLAERVINRVSENR